MAPEPDTNAIPIPLHSNGVHPAMCDFLMTSEQVAQEAIDGIPPALTNKSSSVEVHRATN